MILMAPRVERTTGEVFVSGRSRPGRTDSVSNRNLQLDHGTRAWIRSRNSSSDFER